MILVTKRLKRGLITKMLPWETRIGLQIKIPKVVFTLLRGLGALLVGRNIWVGVLMEQMVVLHVVIRETRLGISPTLKQKANRSIKLP